MNRPENSFETFQIEKQSAQPSPASEVQIGLSREIVASLAPKKDPVKSEISSRDLPVQRPASAAPANITVVPAPISATTVEEVTSPQFLPLNLNHEMSGEAEESTHKFGGLAALSQSDVQSATQTVPRSDVQTARSVAAQLVTVVTHPTASDRVEVRLEPEELGRLRLMMTVGETGMSIQITAERQDTLDLIRRHALLLEDMLAQEGFEDLSFSFQSSEWANGSGGSGSSHEDVSDSREWQKDHSEACYELQTTYSVVDLQRLDLRV